MKKFLIVVLVGFIVAVFFYNCMTGGHKKEQRVEHKYEVLLSTKDTLYVDAWFYESSSATFTSKRTVVFYDTHFMDILTINDPICIRKIK